MPASDPHPLKIYPNKLENWRLIQKQNFTRMESLADFLELDARQRARLVLRPNFPLQLPLRLAQKMAKNTLDDPLVRQFLPLQEELQVHAEFVQDPVCDFLFQHHGLLRKYSGRCLLLCSRACAMHCRYCFRQNFDHAPSPALQRELSEIARDDSLHEVILSGGDPLSLSNERLQELLNALSAIPHVKRIRFHTRFPIGIPERIDDPLLNLLAGQPQQIYVVIHCNHPRELDRDLFDRFKALQRVGCTLLNQAVLLRGVNDNLECLLELAEQLADHGIPFYYLHQLDRVQGAAHFEVEEARGRQLLADMAKNLSGYAVPRYVREIAGEPHKTPL